MKHTNYFLISPKTELISRLQERASPLADLAQPVMWSGAEYDKSRLEPASADLLIKLLFLDTLIRERSATVDFKGIFPDTKVSESYFNSLWTLQRVQLDMSMEISIEDAIASGTIKSIRNTGNEQVDKLLEFYRIQNSIG